jgi:two-component system NtrC family sensor kinase
VLLLHNITTRHEQHEQIKEEKKKALDNLIMGMTQELEYPLKGLQETSDLLISQYHGRDFEYIGFKEFNAMMKILKKMSDQLKGCSSTINRLMVLKRKKLGLTHSSCNAHNIVREVLRHYSQKLKSLNVEVEFKFNASWPIVAMAAFEFHQIFSNILTNAMQSMPSGGKIHIKTTTMKDRKIFLIECRDEGGGIPEENLSRVFDPFFTTKDHGAERNSGLGLSIVASLIHAHHGEVDIDSRLGEGTNVRMFIPTQKNHSSKS